MCPEKLYNFTTGKPFNIFPKFFFQWVGIHEESSPVQGRWSAGVINYLENYYRKTVEYFCIILFALSRY